GGGLRRPTAQEGPGSASDASSTNHTPSGNACTSSFATSNASCVLPTPPVPVNVTSRPTCHRRSRTAHALGDATPSLQLLRQTPSLGTVVPSPPPCPARSPSESCSSPAWPPYACWGA